jgi:hypothetical protein
LKKTAIKKDHIARLLETGAFKPLDIPKNKLFLLPLIKYVLFNL